MALIELARFDNRIAAELVRLRFESEGLTAVLFDAEMNSFGWGPLMPVRLMGLEEERERAEELLADD